VADRYALDLLHVHYAIPHSISAMLAQQMMAPKRRIPFVTTPAWHRYYSGGRGPFLFSDHQVFD